MGSIVPVRIVRRVAHDGDHAAGCVAKQDCLPRVRKRLRSPGIASYRPPSVQYTRISPLCATSDGGCDAEPHTFGPNRARLSQQLDLDARYFGRLHESEGKEASQHSRWCIRLRAAPVATRSISSAQKDDGLGEAYVQRVL